MRVPVLTLIALGALASTGCMRASEISRERAERAQSAGDPRIVVIPLNTAVRLAKGLEAAVEPVQREILSQLSAQGARVSFLAEEDAQALWRQAVQALRDLNRNSASLETTTGTYVRALRDAVAFDFVLMPSLGYREAQVDADRASAVWDGTKRSMTARRQTWALAETVPAYSLHVQLYTPDGRLWYERWGGLDLVHLSDLSDDPALSSEQVAETLDLIAAGVAVALRRSSE